MKMVNLLFLLAVPLVSAPVFSAHAFVEKQTAVVRIMSKAAGKAQTISLPVGRQADYEKLNLLVQNCKQTDPFQPENFFMFLQVSKQTEGQIFSGWMNRNEPGYNPLQNADYDIWLVKCE